MVRTRRERSRRSASSSTSKMVSLPPPSRTTPGAGYIGMRFHHRQIYPEFASLARLALCFNCAFTLSQDPVNRRQTEPVPFLTILVEKNGSKMCACVSFDMPIPVSLHGERCVYARLNVESLLPASTRSSRTRHVSMWRTPPCPQRIVRHSSARFIITRSIWPGSTFTKTIVRS